MFWIQYSSRVFTVVEDVIVSQSVVFRCVYVYVVLFISVSLVIGLFNLIIFLRGRVRLGGLDMFFLDFIVINMLVILFSFIVISRFDYLVIINLSCVVFFFLVNVCYFNVQYVQLVMFFVFLLQGFLFCLRAVISGVQRFAVGLVVFGGCVFCSFLGVVVLLGTFRELDKIILCQVDSLIVWFEYEIVKVSLGFGVVFVLKLAFFILFIVQLVWRVVFFQRDTVFVYFVVLVIVLIMFVCRFFYNMAFLQRVRLKLQRDIGLFRDEFFMNLAELVLFGESCVNFLVIFFFYKFCRFALFFILVRFTYRCRRGEVSNSFFLKRVGS